jgi:translation initiation factor 2 subunit 2
MSENNYRKLLEDALSQLPPRTEKVRRLQLPKPETSISGNRTFLYNFNEICDVLNRKKNIVLKYFAGDLATAGTIEGAYAVFQGTFSNQNIDQVLNRFVKEYVICSICHRPDTQIFRKARYYLLKCEACGATSSLRSI